MKPNPHELTYKLLAELGIENADPKLASETEDHFAKIILEVFLRRLPAEKLPELDRLSDAKNSADLEVYVTEEAAQIPGLASELEAAIAREYELMKAHLETP